MEAIRELLEAATAGDPVARARVGESWPQIVALCCRDPRARASLSDLAPAVEALAAAEEEEAEVDGLGWIPLVLRVLHEEPFVAIEPATGTGIGGRMSGVVDNFQLHTLLMDAFPARRRSLLGRRGRRVSESAAAVARGEGEQLTDEQVRGQWNLYTHEALRGGVLPDGENPLAVRELLIWNEGTPADIPVLEGHRVILLGEPSYERTWQSSRTFADLPATLEPRPLSDHEVRAWLDRCQTPAGRGG